jgi:hypothetical protein
VDEAYYCAPTHTNLRTTNTCISRRTNRCCSPGDISDDSGGIVIPIANVGGIVCCEENTRDLIGLNDRYLTLTNELDTNETNIKLYGRAIDDLDDIMRKDKTTLENQFKQLARLEENYNDLLQ